MQRVIALTTGPEQEPCSRLRVYSMAAQLRAQGLEVTVAPFMSDWLYRNKNRLGLVNGFLKFASVLGAVFQRGLVGLGLVFGRWDVLFVQKESLPWGPPIIERLATRAGARLIYDIDDGVMVKCSMAGRWRMLWWDPNRVPTIMSLADAVIVGSSALEEYASQFSTRIVRIPTAVPDEQYEKSHGRAYAFRGERPVVGWIGTRTNVRYLQAIVPALEEVNARTGFTLLVVGGYDIGECNFGSLTVEKIPWTLAGETHLLHRMDVGLMPLPDEEWARYKCGYKILQYMAADAIALASPVGENSLIVNHGVNGLLCASPSEWAESLESVLSDDLLRARLRAAARETVAPYAMSVIAPSVARVVLDVLVGRPEYAGGWSRTG